MGVRKQKLGAWHEKKTEDKSVNDCEVHIENDEYEREQQCLVKQIKHMVAFRNYHILSFCAVQNHAYIL